MTQIFKNELSALFLKRIRLMFCHGFYYYEEWTVHAFFLSNKMKFSKIADAFIFTVFASLKSSAICFPLHFCETFNFRHTRGNLPLSFIFRKPQEIFITSIARVNSSFQHHLWKKKVSKCEITREYPHLKQFFLTFFVLFFSVIYSSPKPPSR